MKQYIAVIEGTEKDGFSLYFPDFPGCISYGDTMDQAYKNTIEALALHMSDLIKDHAKIPNPSHIQDIHIDDGDKPSILVSIPLIGLHRKKLILLLIHYYFHKWIPLMVMVYGQRSYAIEESLKQTLLNR